MAGSPILLKKLVVNDAASLSAIAIKAYCDHYLHLWDDGGDWYIEKCFSISNLEEELADPNAVFYLVFDKDEAVGFLKINIDAAFGGFSKKASMELERIYLTRDASGKGIGSYLLRWFFDFAIERNKKLVWLKVMDSSLPAINFYKRHGFEICGSARLDFVQMKEEFRGMILMRKRL